eukprot:12226652-Alexandrium_andersonii.AAC.1
MGKRRVRLHRPVMAVMRASCPLGCKHANQHRQTDCGRGFGKMGWAVAVVAGQSGSWDRRSWPER